MKNQQHDIPTSTLLDSSQEPLKTRRDPDPTPLRIGGSWAASWWLEASVDEDGYSVPGGRQLRQNRLGLPGFPEIDFRPYDFGTNRSADRGPSLVGHPVSFEVVGPTSRSPMLDFQWVLTDNSASPALGDVLKIDTISPRSELGSPASPDFTNTPSIKNIFGISALPPQGLYLVISQTGAHAWLGNPPNEGGLPDGVAGAIARFVDREPIEKIRPESGYEVFRVIAVGLDYLELDTAKRVRDHFTIPAIPKPVIRAVTLLRPAAARLVAIPDPAGSRATTYVFVPPRRSLCGDAQPPFTTWTAQDPKSHLVWAGYSPQPDFGLPGDYGEAVALPIPRPSGSGAGHLPGKMGDTVPSPPGTGRWTFFHDAGDVPQPGQVIRVYRVERVQGAVTWVDKTSASLQDPGISRAIGYFEVVEVAAGPPAIITLRRISEFDPETGVAFEAPFDALVQQAAVAGQQVSLGYTVHDPVESLWKRPILDLDALDAAKLRGLIPPTDAGRSLEAPDGQLPGQTPHRPDRAALVTTSTGGSRGSCANPGNLLDLGFRVVLYPARVGAGGELEPDFDHPIPSEEVALDPQAGGSQQYWVNYEASALFLSIPPRPGPGCEVCPDPATLRTADNPRGEVVLFASFVAKSMEPAGNLRVMGAASVGEDPDPCAAGGSEAADPASSRTWFRLSPQRVSCPGYPERTFIDLDAPYDPLALPECGYVELLLGSSTDAAPMFRDGQGNRASTVAYERVGKWGTPAKIRLLGVSGGLSGSFVDVGPASPGIAVLRRTISTPSDPSGRPGTDYRRDLNYGAAVRAPAIRFAGSRVKRLGDGSVEVQLRDARAASHERLFRDLFSPSVLSGCEVAVVGPALVRVQPGWVLLAGVRGRCPETTMAVPDGVSYVYVSGADPCHPRPDISLTVRPLPGPEDVVLARITAMGGMITEVMPLQLYLRDIDYRLDLFVGKRLDRAVYGEPAPHFETLAAAVDYVGELLNPAFGMSGYQVRIRVVGPTQETRAPITIPCDGLVIEGVSQQEEGMLPGNRWGIGWDHPAAPLIDLKGHHDVVVRNVAFVYTAPPRPPHPSPDRVVFTSLPPAAPVRNLLLDRVALYGRDQCQGLIYIQPTGGLISSSISGCVIEGVTDFGVYVENGSSDLRISDCAMRASPAGPQTTLPGPAAVYLGPSADNALQSIVSGISAIGFQVGVWVERHLARITTTAVHSSLREAFVVSSGAQVEMVSCNAVNAAVRGAPKIGIRVLGGRRFAARGCRIELFSMGPGDFALLMQASSYGYVSDFYTSANMRIDDDTVLVGGASGGFLQTGDRCQISGTTAQTLFSGKDCQVSSSWFQPGPRSFLADRTVVRGSTFLDLDVPTGAILDSCTIQGNLTAKVGAENLAFVNCTFGNDDVNMSVGGSVFRGCRFIRSLTLVGSRNIVDSNYINPLNEANLVVVGPPGARAFQNQVRGNILTGRGGIYVDADQSMVSGNTVLGSETFKGLGYSIVASGLQCVVADNSARAGLLVGLSGSGISDCVVLANSVDGDLFCDSGTSTVVGNRASGTLTVKAGTVGTGNVAKKVDVIDRCIIVGNHATDGNITGNGDGLVVVGNWCEGQIILPDGSSRSVVTGNVAGLLMAKNHAGAVASGNYLSSIFAQLARQVTLSGNFVDNGIDARASHPLIAANSLRSGSVQVLRDRTFVVIGNSGPSLEAPPGATDPDPAPNQAIAMGNRFGSIFGSPGDGRGRGNAA